MQYKKQLIYSIFFLISTVLISACSKKSPLIKHKLLNGPYTKYDEGGHKLMTTQFVDGLQHGKQVAYYKNGNIMIEYYYENGQRNGIATSYQIDGSIQHSVIYKDGKIVKNID